MRISDWSSDVCSSDLTEVSLLIGLAFALFYTVLGLPIAWIADRWNRRNLILVGVALWSAMTAGCGFAGSYATLFLARSEEHTSELQSLMRISYAVFCFIKKTYHNTHKQQQHKHH